MEHSLYVRVALELFEEIRWVRFGKRTQKWGVKRGVGSVFDPVLGEKPTNNGATLETLRSNNVRGRETGAQRTERPRRSVALHAGDYRYRWALDSLAGGDIVKLESDKICRI